jgi:hypothetical protein
MDPSLAAAVNRILSPAALGLTMGVATVPAIAAPKHDYAADVAGSALAARAVEAPRWTSNALPHHDCYDQADPNTCQTWRKATGPGGNFGIRDFKNGDHQVCFEPNSIYGVCTETTSGKTWGEIFNPRTHFWDVAPYHDERCIGFGNRLSAGYLACEANQVPSRRRRE